MPKSYSDLAQLASEDIFFFYFLLTMPLLKHVTKNNLASQKTLM
jgi:hypothetical protein